MKTLILSCNTGEGHNSCAKAIEEYYIKQGETCSIEDGLQFVSSSFSKFISWSDIFIYKHLPTLFNWGYSKTEKHSDVFQEDAMLYKMFATGTDRLYEYIKENAFDRVICTHVFAALMLSAVIRKYKHPLVTGFVATDYTCYPGVKDCCLDYYFIPNDALSKEFEEAVPANKIVPAGIPIRQMFFQKKEKEDAKRQWGISKDHKHLLIMCGSMGCGPIKKISGTLAEKLKPDWDATIVCGNNHKLQEELEDNFRGISNIHIRGFVKDMSSLLDSADLYLTKPGGLSVTEAALKGVPMVFVDAVAGCEEYNRAFFMKIGGAKSADNLEELAENCLFLLESDDSRKKMELHLGVMAHYNAAEIIHKTMKKEWKKQYGKDGQQKEMLQNTGTDT